MKCNRTTHLPFYCTSLTDELVKQENESESKKYNLSRNYTVEVTVMILGNEILG